MKNLVDGRQLFLFVFGTQVSWWAMLGEEVVEGEAEEEESVEVAGKEEEQCR